MKQFKLIIFVLGALISYPSLYAATVDFSSRTFPRFLDSVPEENSTGLYVPTYEYLTLNVNTFGIEGLSLSASGWGRLDIGRDIDSNDGDGDLLYGYLDYRESRNLYHVRLGRQFLFRGVALDNMDGIFIDGISPYGLVMEGFAGKPVLSKSGDISGDFLYGGRVGYRLPWRLDLGISALQSLENGEADRQNIGLDGFARPIGIVEMSWKLFYSILFEDIYEGSLTASVSPLDWLKVSISGESTDPKVRIGANSIFSVFTEKYYDAGIRIDSHCPVTGIDFNASYYNYQYATDQAHRFSAGAAYSARLLGDNIFGASFEQLTYSDEPTSETMTGYYQFRIFTENTFIEKITASAEYIHTIYDEYINNYNGSDDITVSAGYSILKDLNILGSLYYSITPRYTQEIQGSVFITYLFGTTF